MSQVVLASYAKIYTYTLTVSTTATSFTLPPSSIIKNVEKVQVQAPSTNTAPVLIGPSGITGDYNNGGIELIPGASTVTYYNLDELLKAISTSGTQKLLVTYYSEPNG